jgi:hypothetical protein
MEFNAENLTFFGVMGGVILAFARWITGLLVKPLIKRIDELESGIVKNVTKDDDRDKLLASLATAEDKNAKAIDSVGGRVARIDDRVIEANYVSTKNQVSMAEANLRQEQLVREKTKLFEKTDRYDDEISSIKERLAKVEK